MILQILSRQHALQALQYGARMGRWLTTDGPAREIAGTLPAGASLAEWREEFRRVAALNPGIKKNVVHLIISFSDEDRKLGPIQLAQIAHEAMGKLGYADCPARWTEHMDGHTQHLHGVVSAVTHSGERVDRTNDRWLGQQISRQTELDYGLHRVGNTKGQPVLPPLPIAGEIVTAIVPLPAPGWHHEVVRLVRQVLRPGVTLPQFRDELAALGVRLEIIWSRDGSKIGGLGYRYNGRYDIASHVHKEFSLAGLKGQGLDYSASRDIPLLAPPVLGPPAALLVAKIPTLHPASIPRIAAVRIAPATLPLPHISHIPEVHHVQRPKLSLLQSIYALAAQLASRLWRAAAAPADVPAIARPRLPGR